MTFPPDDAPENTQDQIPRWERPAPIPGDQGSTAFSDQSLLHVALPDSHLDGSVRPEFPFAPVAPTPPDPAWNGWDVVRLILLTIVALFAGVFAVLLVARWKIYPHTPLGDIMRNPLVVVAGQALAYLLILGYMYILVTRERGRPDFLKAIHWNFPSNIALYVLGGFVLSVALQAVAHFLPIPKDLPIDTFFKTPAEAWALGILSITLAPLMEELFFADSFIRC